MRPSTTPSSTRCPRRSARTGHGPRTRGPSWPSSVTTSSRGRSSRTRRLRWTRPSCRRAHASARLSTWRSTTTSRKPGTSCTWATWPRSLQSMMSTPPSSTTAPWPRWASARSGWARSRMRTIASWTCACTTRPGSCSRRAWCSARASRRPRSRSAPSGSGSCPTTCTSTWRCWRVPTTSVPCSSRSPTWPWSPLCPPTSASSRGCSDGRWSRRRSRSSRARRRTPRRPSSALPALCKRGTGRSRAACSRTSSCGSTSTWDIRRTGRRLRT
mmetsp:Transcript_38285/g.102833  ORF Transcript_38285/g.102833 Transcript_38285/m.102833 type:complete len:271 (-) Transcript_38285:683-1495(-)